VRENEIALRKLSGGTAQFRILEGTLASGAAGCQPLASQMRFQEKPARRLYRACVNSQGICGAFHFALPWCRRAFTRRQSLHNVIYIKMSNTLFSNNCSSGTVY